MAGAAHGIIGLTSAGISMTAKSKKRFRGHDEIILDGSRLGFEIWYRYLLLAKSEGRKIDYAIHKDWSLLGDLQQQRQRDRVVEHGMKRTLEQFNARKWAAAMFGKKSTKWHKAFGVERSAVVSKVTSTGVNSGRSDSHILLRVNVGDYSAAEVKRGVSKLLSRELASRGRGRGKSVGRKQRAIFYQVLFSNKQVRSLERSLAVRKALRKQAKIQVAGYYKATASKYEELKLNSSRSNYGAVQRLLNRDKNRAAQLLESVCIGRFDIGL